MVNYSFQGLFLFSFLSFFFLRVWNIRILFLGRYCPFHYWHVVVLFVNIMLCFSFHNFKIPVYVILVFIFLLAFIPGSKFFVLNKLEPLLAHESIFTTHFCIKKNVLHWISGGYIFHKLACFLTRGKMLFKCGVMDEQLMLSHLKSTFCSWGTQGECVIFKNMSVYSWMVSLNFSPSHLVLIKFLHEFYCSCFNSEYLCCLNIIIMIFMLSLTWVCVLYLKCLQLFWGNTGFQSQSVRCWLLYWLWSTPKVQVSFGAFYSVILHCCLFFFV